MKIETELKSIEGVVKFDVFDIDKIHEKVIVYVEETTTTTMRKTEIS